MNSNDILQEFKDDAEFPNLKETNCLIPLNVKKNVRSLTSIRAWYWQHFVSIIKFESVLSPIASIHQNS